MRAALLVTLALIGAACASTSTPVAREPEVVATPTTVQAALLTGPQAIEAAQGTPHILWFWGAN